MFGLRDWRFRRSLYLFSPMGSGMWLFHQLMGASEKIHLKSWVSGGRNRCMLYVGLVGFYCPVKPLAQVGETDCKCEITCRDGYAPGSQGIALCIRQNDQHLTTTWVCQAKKNHVRDRDICWVIIKDVVRVIVSGNTCNYGLICYGIQYSDEFPLLEEYLERWPCRTRFPTCSRQTSGGSSKPQCHEKPLEAEAIFFSSLGREV